MDLNHEFEVPVTVAEAWNILTDVERIAPCLPGAELQEIEGDTYRGVVKVKVGPIQAQFKGQASFVERDEGRDTGGKGNASALITAQLTEVSASSTKVQVSTDLSITGKIAQFGRGAMADISDKLLGQFVENLNTLIASQPAAPAASAGEPAAQAPAAQPDAGPRKIDGPEAKPIDLLDAAGAPILKRALPVVVVVAALIVWLVVK
jgi:carbon monoxide dehydrogenase subunit G